MRILLTGKNGQLGFELQRSLALLGEVTALSHVECNVADEACLSHTIRECKPEVIVNAAAYTAVDCAEEDAETALAVNARAPEIIGREADRLGALVVHYCTDYAYDGQKKAPYTEEDAPHPLGVYGKSKMTGSEVLADQTSKHLIFRTSWVYGAHGKNFIKTILRLAQDRPELKVVADQFGAPTSAALLADVTAQVLGQYKQCEKAGRFPFGLYHCVAAGETTWCDLAQMVVETACGMGLSIQLSSDNIIPIPSTEYPLPAPRPANSRLSTNKLRNTFHLNLPPWQQGVQQMLTLLLEGNKYA